MIMFLKLFFAKFIVLNELEQWSLKLDLDLIILCLVLSWSKLWKIGEISIAPQTDLRQSMSPKGKLLFYPLFCFFPYYHYLFLSKENNEECIMNIHNEEWVKTKILRKNSKCEAPGTFISFN